MNEEQQQQQTTTQVTKRSGKFVGRMKNAAEYATDGSQGSIIDVIKVTIRIISEFVKAVNAKLGNSLAKLADKNEGNNA